MCIQYEPQNPRSQRKFKSSSNSDIENLHLKFSQSKQPKLYHNFDLKDNGKQATKVIKRNASIYYLKIDWYATKGVTWLTK